MTKPKSLTPAQRAAEKYAQNVARPDEWRLYADTDFLAGWKAKQRADLRAVRKSSIRFEWDALDELIAAIKGKR